MCLPKYMKRPGIHGFATLKALTLFVVLGTIAHATIPYLPLVGPPAMRIQKANSPAASVVKFEAGYRQPSQSTNSASTVAADLKSASRDTQNPHADATLPTSAPDSTSAASIFELPTPDLVGITPQMLAVYLHPIVGGTNSAALLGPLPLSFVPPVPMVKSSQATYNVK